MPLYPLRRLIIPVALLVAAAVLRPRAAGLDTAYLKLLDLAPYLSLGIVLLMCAYYKTSRVFAAALALVVVYFFVQSQLQVALVDVNALYVYTGISLALPLVMFLLFILPERGLWNRYGAIVVAIIPVLAIAGVLLRHFVPYWVLQELLNTMFPVKPFAGYVLSVNASFAFLLALAPGLFRLYRYDSELDAALLGVLLFVYVALVWFDHHEISTLMFGFAGVSLIISMARSIHDMAFRDELTGLPGRRALNQRLKGLGKHYSIAMIDVDHFKKFNDDHGHDMGDQVLKMVAGHIAGVGGGGTAYRFGGEEFCVVFPGRDIEHCKPFLEAVRACIANYAMRLRDPKTRARSPEIAAQRRGRRTNARDGKAVSVTISIGLAMTSDMRNTAAEILKAADAALYRAKKQGRNRLVSSR